MVKDIAIVVVSISALVTALAWDKADRENEQLRSQISQITAAQKSSTEKIEEAAQKKEGAYAASQVEAVNVFAEQEADALQLLRADIATANGLLHESENRASLYRKRAESGELAAATLADQVGRMDRALSEGSILVVELRNALKKRDREIELATTEIQDLRALISKQD